MDAELIVETRKAAREGVSVIRLTGPFTIKGVFAFQNVVRAEQAPALIIDLTDVPYLDSAGIGSLVLAHVSCERAGRKLALVGVAQRAMDVMRLTRVDQLFKFFPTVEDAAEKM